jgi:hypothetical protein
MDNHADFMELRPDHVFRGNESMNKGSALSRQYLSMEGIVEVLDLIRMTNSKDIRFALHEHSS